MAMRPKHAELIDWPAWVPGAFGMLALVTGVAVIAQRNAAGQGLARPSAFAALVLLPYVLEFASILTKRRFALPKVLFPVPIFIGMWLLMVNSLELDFAPFVLVFLSAQMAAESGDRPIFGIVVTVIACASMVLAEVFGPHDDSFIWVIGIAFGWFGGYSVETLANQTSRLKLAYAELEEKATAEERQRIAREVHDVIAHSLSVTMLHITAARMALEKGTTEPALDALREAELQGRRSLAEIRRTVGLLGPDESASAPPMPDAADLPKLVTDFRNAGLDVTLWIEGDIGSLPQATGLNLYRIVQESLTNVTKHAPGSKATVNLFVSDDDIRLRVHNTNGIARPEGSNGGGLGIKGIGERAGLIGGTLATDDRDGFTVLVVAPRTATPERSGGATG